MKPKDIIRQIIAAIISICVGVEKRATRRKQKKIYKEIEQLEQKYKKALEMGDISNIVYYRQRINDRLYHVELCSTFSDE